MTGPIFVTGAGGRLGAAIVATFRDCDIVASTRGSLDITDSAAVRRAVAAVSPSVIINCAAFNLVDAAEQRPSEALAVNALAVRALARAADDVGAVFVHYGTDFVLDGAAAVPYREDAPPAPRSTYGQSKLLGEWLALDAQRGFVLRVESLFGAPRGWQGRQGTLDGMLDALGEGRTVKAFTDRVVSPAYVDDVARATRHLVDTQSAPGLYHCVNSGMATWFQIAQNAARLMGVAPRIEAATTDAQALAAQRPKFCALDNGKLRAAGFVMPPWEDALARWIAVRGGTMGTIQ